MWLAKDQLYPDSLWETSCSLASAAFLFASLGLSFWGSIVVLTQGRGRCYYSPNYYKLVLSSANQCCPGQYDPGPVQLASLLAVFILGLWLHHAADAQKYFVLRAKCVDT